MPRTSGMADREPCPWRIIDDVGGAFCMGCIGGGIWHVIKGYRMAPPRARFIGAIAAVQARSPVLGGQFAIWGGIFASCDCTLTYVRQKEDPWNSIASGGITGGILAARAGPQAAFTSAFMGAVLLALIEGLGIMFTQALTPKIPTPEQYAEMAAQAQQQQQQMGRGGTMVDPTAPPMAAPSFFGFGSTNNAATSSSSTSSPTTTTAPPSIMDEGTFFERETTNTSSNTDSSSTSWWPFRSKS